MKPENLKQAAQLHKHIEFMDKEIKECDNDQVTTITISKETMPELFEATRAGKKKFLENVKIELNKKIEDL